MEYTLIGVDSNAFSIVGYVKKAMKKEGKSIEEVNSYRNSAMAGDYNNLLRLSMEMVEKLNESS